MTEATQPYRRKTHYYETDQMGIIHHANFIRWFEEARVDYLDKIGLPYAGLEAQGILIPVLGIGCDYIASVVFNEEISIKVTTAYFNGLKMTIEYEVTASDTGMLKAKGFSRHCFTDASLKPIRMKRDYPEIFGILNSYVEK